jgi:hypothetical protein
MLMFCSLAQCALYLRTRLTHPENQSRYLLYKASFGLVQHPNKVSAARHLILIVMHVYSKLSAKNISIVLNPFSLICISDL